MRFPFDTELWLQWQVTLCDPPWQLGSSEMTCWGKLYRL